MYWSHRYIQAACTHVRRERFNNMLERLRSVQIMCDAGHTRHGLPEIEAAQVYSGLLARVDLSVDRSVCDRSKEPLIVVQLIIHLTKAMGQRVRTVRFIQTSPASRRRGVVGDAFTWARRQ
ncbi:unnamed protein product [Danaus chrysippus]|uniref:(African queen) hypothetical protein n=1 Tax=Danaus chrysippus TaxID=151541 RepID=A0A8J2QZ85_9NEOP|nr:unnamed protein product [Danaus chrysippus]